MKLIFVGSENPVKVGSTLLGFQEMFPTQDFVVSGKYAPSLVSAQPKTEQETLNGAINRADYLQKHVQEADFCVGIEGGVEKQYQKLATFAWVVIKSKDGLVGIARTATFFLPDKVANLIAMGNELGQADDIIFGTSNSKQSNGSVGILTGNVLTRTTYYKQAVILALIPFKNPTLY